VEGRLPSHHDKLLPVETAVSKRLPVEVLQRNLGERLHISARPLEVRVARTELLDGFQLGTRIAQLLVDVFLILQCDIRFNEVEQVLELVQ
jgi:hypothetical protein